MIHYEDFYDSEWWQEERERVLEDWDGFCERCGCETDSPHVHHKYGLNFRIYEILCPDCHAEHHSNDEIANYRKQTPICKYCGKEIEWGKDEKGKWIPFEPGYVYYHKCRGFTRGRCR